MISREEMQKAFASGGTVLLKKGRLIDRVEEIPAVIEKPAEVPVGTEIPELSNLKNQVEEIKSNQADVTKLSSVQSILSLYDREIAEIYQNFNINDLTVIFENKLAG